MVELMPSPPEAVRNPLEAVLAGVIGAGAQAPAWVAVDDGSGAWIARCAASSPVDRARGVLAAADDEALVAGRRLGVGGAMPLPPSTPAAREALQAAAEAPPPTGTIDPDLFGTLEAGSALQIVSLSDRSFWRSQLGDRALLAQLFRLAAALDAAPVTVAWPALVITGRDRSAIESAWNGLTEGSGPYEASVVVTECDWPKDGDVVRAISRSLESTADLSVTREVTPLPVHELPSGDPLGWWAPRAVASPTSGWLATPGEATGAGHDWVLVGETRGEVAEVLLSREIVEAAGKLAVRVPGWLTFGLRPGTPAGLLVQRLADGAARRGVPLWVPNLDAKALRFVLRLPGTLWVDGPAVPR